jgi:hypothetical protein
MSEGETCDYTNLFNLTQYDGDCSFFGGTPALPEALGWFIVVGLGAVFSIITSIIIWIDNK